MSSVNLCERKGCKAMMTGGAVALVGIVTSSTKDAERIQVEICPGCLEDFLLILGTEPVTPREPAYREGWKRPQDDSVAGMSGEQLAAMLLEKLMAQKTIEATPTTVPDKPVRAEACDCLNCREERIADARARRG